MSAFVEHMGKIGGALFKDILLPNHGYHREEVRVGPGFGVDTAVVDLGNNLGMAISSDPISLIPSLGLKESAWLSVHLTANDMATTGFAPRYAQFVMNLPASLSLDDFKIFWGHIHTCCHDIGVAITGGHTGQVPGQNSTMPGGCTMFLTAPADRIVTGNHARPGNLIVMTGETAISSTAILAKSFPKTVKEKLGPEVYRKACDNFFRTSVLRDGLAAAEILVPNKELRAMHDVTEGGVLGAVIEMAVASGCGFRVDNNKLLTGTAQQQICELFEIDHRFCIGAGSMIMAVENGNADALVQHLQTQGIPASVIGEFTGSEGQYRQLTAGRESELKFDGTDPYWQAFFKALEEGIQ